MAAKVALEAVFMKSRNRWRVDVPASRTTNGVRIRANFKTREAARDYILKLDGPTPSAAIDPRLAMDADTARQRIEAAGLDMTLAEIVAAYVEARDAMNGTGTLLEAARAFRAAHDTRAASKPMGEAVTEFMDMKRETLRDATAKSYAYTLERTLEPLHDRNLADITTDELAAILGHRKPTARAMHLRTLRVFWAWASKEKRAWASMATVDALEYRKDASEADISVMTPAEVVALLRAAEAEGHAAAVTTALLLFAGIRRAEITRLTWGNVSTENVEIGRDAAKKIRRRTIPICPTLAAWIAAHRDGAKDSDLITPANWTEVDKCIRRRAGWAVEARLLKNPPKPTRGAWPSNVIRHTNASVLVSIGTPLKDLTFQFGHTGGHDTLRSHYVGQLTKKDALAILSTGPKGQKIKLVQVA
jgi:integrase